MRELARKFVRHKAAGISGSAIMLAALTYVGKEIWTDWREAVHAAVEIQGLRGDIIRQQVSISKLWERNSTLERDLQYLKGQVDGLKGR